MKKQRVEKKPPSRKQRNQETTDCDGDADHEADDDAVQDSDVEFVPDVKSRRRGAAPAAPAPTPRPQRNRTAPSLGDGMISEFSLEED